MGCDKCGETSGHNRFCPMPCVRVPAAGVATSDWIDALMAVLTGDGTVFSAGARELLTEGYVLHSRSSVQQGILSGAIHMATALRTHDDLLAVADAAAKPAAMTDLPLIHDTVDAVLADVVAAAPSVEVWMGPNAGKATVN